MPKVQVNPMVILPVAAHVDAANPDRATEVVIICVGDGVSPEILSTCPPAEVDRIIDFLIEHRNNRSEAEIHLVPERDDSETVQ